MLCWSRRRRPSSKNALGPLYGVYCNTSHYSILKIAVHISTKLRIFELNGIQHVHEKLYFLVVNKSIPAKRGQLKCEVYEFVDNGMLVVYILLN